MNAVTFWILMLSRAGEASGLPMAVFTEQAACERQVAFYDRTHAELGLPDKPREMRWHCLGVLMPRSAVETSPEPVTIPRELLR